MSRRRSCALRIMVGTIGLSADTCSRRKRGSDVKETRPTIPLSPNRASTRTGLTLVWASVLVVVLIAVVCYSLVMPLLRTHSVLQDYARHEHIAPTVVDELGGPDNAHRLLRRYLRLPSSWTSNRQRAVTCLGDCGKTAMSTLLILTKDPDRKVRTEAAAMLSFIDPKPGDVAPSLRKLLRDPDGFVRVQSALSLWQVARDADATVLVLVEALGCADARVQARAAEVLGDMGPAAREAVPALIKTVRKTESWEAIQAGVHSSAVYALGAVRDERAVPILIEVLEDDDPTIYGKAVYALGTFGPKAKMSIPVLNKLLGRNVESQYDEDMRTLIMEALRKISNHTETSSSGKHKHGKGEPTGHEPIAPLELESVKANQPK